MQTGTCSFCGQMQSLNYECESREEANEQAILLCNCAQAQTHANRHSQISRAKAQIEEMFGQRASEQYGLQAIDEDIIDSINNMLPIIQEERIKNISITVIMKDQIKINIGYSNDKFSIKRSESNSVKREI